MRILLILGVLVVPAIVLSIGCDGENAVDWKATNNPCSSDFRDDPQTVDGLVAEIKAEGVPKSDRDRYADELDADAQLNEENQLLARAAQLRCKAWLLRHQ